MSIHVPRPTRYFKPDLRSPRRQQQVRHLVSCGARCVLEALLDVERGRDLDETLGDFERLLAETYHAALMLFLDEGAT